MKYIFVFGVSLLSLLATGCGSDSSTPDGDSPGDSPTDGRPDRDDWCARSPDLCRDPPPPDPCDVDADGSRSPECGGADCDDNNSAAHPGANEYPCDGVDQDCNGRDSCQPDADMDGSRACEAGETGMGCDCDDSDPTISPGSADVPCDGIDQNCSGFDSCGRPDEDGDGLGACTPGAPATCDCDDADASVYWGAPEVACDAVDQSCSGVDCCNQDDDMDGYACREDCNDGDQDVYPGACAPGGTWPPQDFNCDGAIDARDSCDGSGLGGI